MAAAFTIALCTVLIYVNAVNSVKQEIVLYEKPQETTNINMTAPHLALTESTPNVTFTLETANSGSKLNSMTGACTNGMWMVYSKPNYAAEGRLLSNLIQETKVGQAKKCVNMSETSIESVRHAGNPEMSISALSLYNSTSMAAGRELYFEGYQLVLPSTMEFGSYGFTGGTPWRLSPDMASSSGNVCLALPTHTDVQFNETKGNILTYKENITLSVQKITQVSGCTNDTNERQVDPDYDITPFMGKNATNQLPPMHGMANSSGLSLTLITKPNTNVSGNLSFIGKKLRLIEPMLLLNYTFTGTPAKNWTVYSDVDGTKGARCLVYGTVLNANGSTTAEKTYVGAIEMGCDMAGSSSALFSQFTGTLFIALLGYVVLK